MKPKCSICSDNGFINITDPHKPLYTFVQECECVIKMKELAKKENLLRYIGLPIWLWNKTFDSFINDSDTLEIFKDVRTYSDNHNGGKNLLLYSNHYGCGKTHLSTAVILKNKDNQVCGYLNAAEFFSELKSSGFVDFKEKSKAARDADVLLMDDLTSSSPENWKKEFYYTILNERSSCGRSTIITANISKPDDLSKYLGGMAFDRLGIESGRCICIEFPEKINSKR